MARVVVYDQFGGPDVLHLIDVPIPDPGPGEVRVRIEAFAVNPLDLMMRAGEAPGPDPIHLPGARLGVEATGIVDAVGEGVTRVQPGAPVIIAAIPDAPVNGSYAEYVVIPADRVIARPAGLDVPEAAAIWVAFSTAYGALVETAAMRPGDHVLITAASGSVGRAAIQVANHLGAIPIAVTRHRSKEAALIAAGAAAVITRDRDDLVETARHHTDGTGVGIVLDLVGGPGQIDLRRAARPDAALIAAGFLASRPGDPYGGPASFEPYASFVHVLDDTVVRRMAAFLEAGVRLGSLRPAVAEVFTMDAVAEAHRQVESGAHAGKVVVTTPGLRPAP